MRGAVLYGPRDIRFEDRETPKIVEPSDAIQMAREIAIASGCGDQIEFIQKLSTGIDLPERPAKPPRQAAVRLKRSKACRTEPLDTWPAGPGAIGPGGSGPAVCPVQQEALPDGPAGDHVRMDRVHRVGEAGITIGD